MSIKVISDSYYCFCCYFVLIRSFLPSVRCASLSYEVKWPKVAKLLKDRFLLRLFCCYLQVKALWHLEVLEARAAAVLLCAPPHIVPSHILHCCSWDWPVDLTWGTEPDEKQSLSISGLVFD